MEELFKISELQARYGLNSKQAVYDRINKLHVIPHQKGYVSNEQLDLLDRLDGHLKSGGTFKNFAIEPEIEPLRIQKIEEDVDGNVESGEGSLIYQRIFDWMGGIIEKLLATSAIATSPLDKFEELEKAADMEIVLPTSAIAQLIGFKPHGLGIVYGCYSIQRCKQKVGRESGWLIIKEKAQSLLS